MKPGQMALSQKVMKSYKNKVLPGENTVTTGDVFCSFLRQPIKKPVDMTPKAFKTCFKILMKQSEDLDAKYELNIGNKKWNLCFSMPLPMSIKMSL